MKYVLGADVGSTSSKCVILSGDGDIIARSLVNAGTGTSGPARAMAEALAAAGKTMEELSYILATGYGRKTLACADGEMSEMSCHARGAHHICPEARTVIDIGGQDAKVLRLDAKGALENFVMNDKCAAGTGRFLEVMAKILELSVDKLEAYDLMATSEIAISSTCTVFAESEVISQLAKGSAAADVVRGIHRSVAGRTAGLVMRLGVAPRVLMTGGVSRNGGVRRALEHDLGMEIAVSDLSQYAGALGAALYALQKDR